MDTITHLAESVLRRRKRRFMKLDKGIEKGLVRMPLDQYSIKE